MDKTSIIEEILKIYHSEPYPSESETVATIKALSNIVCHEALTEIKKLYEKSMKSSDVRIATIHAISLMQEVERETT